MSIDETYAHVATSFDKLQRALMSLENVPLPIVSVKCTSAYYRRTKALPPTGVAVVYTNRDVVENGVAKIPEQSKYLPPFLPSIKVIISLQKSGKWGDDLSVIAKLKSAFYVDISKRLKLAHPFFTMPTETELYAIVERIVFRIRIIHHHEIVSYGQLNDANEGEKLSRDTAFTLRRNLVLKPMISLQLLSLAQRCPAFAESCVYAKMWLNASFLSKMFEGIAIELIVAYVYLHEKATPRTGIAGFCRFIALLATFEFAAQPLVVDINHRFNHNTLTQAKQNFINRRPALPPLVILLPEDQDGIMFSAKRPETVVFLRAIHFARHMHQRISALTLEKQSYSEFELPNHDLVIYDVVIRIALSSVPLKSKKEAKKSFTVTHPKKAYLPVVDFEPVKLYVRELRRLFNDKALFFFNSRRPSSIGVVLRPTFIEELKSKDGDEEKMLETEAFTAELKEIGDGMIRHVEIASRLREKLGVADED